MAYLFRFDNQDRILRAVIRGTVSETALVEFYSSLEKHAGLHAPSVVLVDWSGVTEFNISGTAIRNLATKPTKISAVRIYIAPQDHIYGMARMFQALAIDTRPRLHVVRTEEEWRNLPN